MGSLRYKAPTNDKNPLRRKMKKDGHPPSGSGPVPKLKRKRVGEIYVTLDELNRLKLKSSKSYTDAESDKGALTFPKVDSPNHSTRPSLHLLWHMDETDTDREESLKLMTAFDEVMKVLNDMNVFDDEPPGTASGTSIKDSERTDRETEQLESLRRFKQPMAKLKYSETDSGLHVKEVHLGGGGKSKAGEKLNLSHKFKSKSKRRVKFHHEQNAHPSDAPVQNQEDEDTRNVIRTLEDDPETLIPSVDKRDNRQDHRSLQQTTTYDSSSENNLIYEEELRFHGFVRDVKRSTIYRVFSVDLRSQKGPFFQNTRVEPKPRNSQIPSSGNKSGQVLKKKQKLLAKNELLVTVPAVDEAFSGSEWKCFDPRKRVKTIRNQFRYLVDLYRSDAVDRPDVAAGRYLMMRKFCFNEGRSVIGSIPGVEVGDRFRFRVELLILIVSRTSQAGIEYIPASLSGYFDKDGSPVSVAVSVVSSGEYKDDEDDGETLIYVGSGGDKNRVCQKLKSSKSAEHVEKDQELIRGNLALKNSCDLGVPVRVIRGEKYYDEDRKEKRKGYWYDGLYDVVRCYEDVGSAGSKVWKFRLVKRKEQMVMLYS